MKRPLVLIVAIILLITCFGCYVVHDRRGYYGWDRGGHWDEYRGERGDREGGGHWDHYRGERGDRDRDGHEERR